MKRIKVDTQLRQDKYGRWYVWPDSFEDYIVIEDLVKEGTGYEKLKSEKRESRPRATVETDYVPDQDSLYRLM